MFLSTVIPSSKLNINCKNVDPYQFSVPFNFVRGRTICVDMTPSHCAIVQDIGYIGVLGLNDGTTENRIVISVPTDVTVHTTNMDVVMMGYFGGQTQRWKYNINITCDTINNIITFTPISYTHLDGTIYRNYVDDRYTWVVLLNIHTKL